MNTTLTLSLTVAQASALEWIIAYGIDEKEQVLSSHPVADYDETEEAEQREVLRHACDAHAQLQGALREATA